MHLPEHDAHTPSSPAPSIATAAFAPDDHALELGGYAQRAYLEYALSVVKGRALPDVCDGLKPVQRRILYAMARMGLGWSGTGAGTAARPVKSARVVGDVLGRFHPHGDQSAYDALVRMAQDFSQRYPLVDGQGNFGSRDGDGAAAMRYTEARLQRMATLLLDEIDEGTVDFTPNYDASTEEPLQLPARLPFALLNGASGIAVGLATEIPSHNLGEVAAACVALLRDPLLDDAALAALIPGPDFPTGGHIISSTAEIAQAYRSGRGSLKVRARWIIEPLARGQWQMVVTELPPGVSTQRVMQEIDALTAPQVKPGKKALTQEQLQLKATMLALIANVRDEAGKSESVRLVIEPKNGKTDPSELERALLAHTSMQSSVSINLTLIDGQGTPVQLGLRAILQQWLDFRIRTVTRRSQHRLERVRTRLHILAGRELALARLDDIIATIRDSDEPLPALIAQFGLSPAQAQDILEMRLRQLARLEAIKIHKEISELSTQEGELADILDHPTKLQEHVAAEISADAQRFADPRRTLIQEEKAITAAAVAVPEEDLTLILSQQGWARTVKGHGVDRSGWSFKTGDALAAAFECRSTDALIVFGHTGRVYSLEARSLPGGRGDGQPLSAMLEMETDTRTVGYFAGAADTVLALISSDGYGFLTTASALPARNRSGKAFVTIPEGSALLPPVVLQGIENAQHVADARLALLTQNGWLLSLPLADLRSSTSGGRGLQLIKLGAGDAIVAAAVHRPDQGLRIWGTGRAGAARELALSARQLSAFAAARAARGKASGISFTIEGMHAL